MRSTETKLATQLRVSKGQIQRAIDWAYDRAVSGGIPGLSTAEQLANDFIDDNDPRERANRLIRWQNAKCATSGFITGVGGFALLPVFLPANITSVLYMQIRMIAAIAHMGGHDLKSDQVRTLVYI